MFKDVNKFKVGDKAKGFKFDNLNENGVHWDAEMDFYVDKIGEVVETYNDSFVIQFGDTLEWMYPLSLAHFAVVEEKVVPFKVGDKVKFKKSSLESGMIDASEYEVFEISHSAKDHIFLKDIPSWWGIEHFECVKKETMNTNKEETQVSQSINWEVGQQVWDICFGVGKVTNVTATQVKVNFGNSSVWNNVLYTTEGIHQTVQCAKNRTLFFSEPQVTAELFPPKKPFVPALKKGDTVVVKKKNGQNTSVFYVEREDEDYVHSSGWKYEKSMYTFYKIGEEIKFN